MYVGTWVFIEIALFFLGKVCLFVTEATLISVMACSERGSFANPPMNVIAAYD